MARISSNESEKERLLSHFTVENLQEAVLWIGSSGVIVQVNEMACKMSGYTREELINMSIVQLNPTPEIADFSKYWQRLKKNKKLVFESKHRHKTGYDYEVEISGNYIEYKGEEFSCSIVRDIRKKKMEEQLLRAVSEATSGLTGQDFLTELSKNVVKILGFRYAFIVECTDESKTRFRTIAFVQGETVLDNFEYDVQGSACSQMLKGKPYFLPSGVQDKFPGAKGIEAYIGCPIISPSTGELLGHIAATDVTPVTEEKNQTAILQIFAARVAAEMERMKAQKELEKKNEELNRRLNEIELYSSTIKNLHTQIFWIDNEGNFIRVNEAVSKETGYSIDELMTMSVFDLNPVLTKEEWMEGWKGTRKIRQQVLETEHRDKEGNLYPVEVTNNFIEHDGAEYFCSSVRDIRKRRMEEELLRVISERTAGVTGEDYFRELTKFVTSTLDVRYSMVVACSNGDNTKLRMLSYVDRKEILENIEYDTKGTPCEIVMEGKDFFCARDLEKSFPREEGIQSWVAVPIFSPSTGKVIGNIAAFDDMPMTKEQNQTAILKIFAARAGAEIERIEAQKKLEKANEELAKHLKEIEALKNQLQAENKYLQEEIKLNNNFEEIVSKSKVFHKVLQQVEQVAPTDATVLITGESGTGKELVARAIHNISNRSKRALVKVNCATLPANLIESELFGHEKGAFTGALERKIGRFELADGGTIFLDEIGELPVELQSKLLRVLQEGEFERLGNPKTMKVNVRVIAATNRPLQTAMEKKEFREDLYYRLNVFPVHCPPLRERKEDIPILVRHFLKKHEGKMVKKISNVESKVIDALIMYDWPGNIRELENLIERAMILSPGNTLEAGDWLPKTNLIANGNGQKSLLKLEEVEKDHIIETLKKVNWKVSGDKGAAKILGLNPTTLEARMKKLGIKREV
jgi:formate hydrogenlyase transcriptional activator